MFTKLRAISPKNFMRKLKLSDFSINIPEIKVENTQSIKVGSYQDYTIQKDACEIIDFALRSSNNSNNIFVVGPTGSGRRSMTRKIVEKNCFRSKKLLQM